MGDYTRLCEAATAAIPTARLVEIGGVGHLPQVEGFDRYVEALTAFFDATPSREYSAPPPATR